MFGRGPEVGDGEAFFEVGAEVVHPADGEEDVCAELGRVRWVSLCGGCGGEGMRGLGDVL